MKTFSDEALAALQRGDAIVSASVEIIPNSNSTTSGIFTHSDTFDYQIIDSIVDSDPPEDVTPPTSGFDSSGSGPFGHIATTGTPMTPAYPVATEWLPQTSLWLKKDITVPSAGTLNLTGRVENGAVFFLDDTLIGSVNADNSQVFVAAGQLVSISASISAGAHTIKILVVDEADAPIGDNDNTYVYVESTVTVASSGAGAATIRLWGGYGDASLPSDEGTSTYRGIGDRSLGKQISAAIGGSAQNLTLTISGIEPATLAVLDPSEVKGASAVVRILIFDSAGKALLGAYVFTRGRVDELKTSEVVGGAASIQLAIEGAARGLGRRGARRRSDADQRLVSPTDGFYRVVSAAPKKTLYWGGKKPSTAGGALSGGAVATSTSSAGILGASR